MSRALFWILGSSLAAVLTSAARADACSCTWGGGLLHVAQSTDALVQIRVLKQFDRHIEVEVLETWRGKVPARLRIYGDDGRLCRPYVTRFIEGSVWLFSISALTDEADATDRYAVSICGEHFVAVSEGKVSGQLFGTQLEARTLTLAELKQRLTAPP